VFLFCSSGGESTRMMGKRYLSLLGLAGLASVASSSEKCVISADGTHSAVDLNALHKSDSDYSLTSDSNPDYKYNFNLCGQTIFRDSKCTEGATVCEIKNDAALDVYGFVDTISLKWHNEALVMNMTGELQCPYNDIHPYSSAVFFYCSTETIVSIRSESIYTCNLEFEYHTPVACGGTVVHYTCRDNQCVPDPNGRFGSRDECSSACSGPSPNPPPPPPGPPDQTYICRSNFTCEAHHGGTFSNFTNCSTYCQPFQKHYSCFNNQCVQDSRGRLTFADCTAGCAKITDKWSCGPDYTCAEDAMGRFGDYDDCMLGCHNPADKLYHCNDDTGECEESDEGIENKGLCDSVCTKMESNPLIFGRQVDLE